MTKRPRASNPNPPTEQRVVRSASARVVDGTARRIRDLHRSAGLQFAYDVGRVVLERFYGGSLEQFRQRAPTDSSLRALARHPELGLSASALYQAIGIFELLERYGGVPA